MIERAIMIPWTMMPLTVGEAAQLVEDLWFKLMMEIGDDYVVIERSQYKYDNYPQQGTVLQVTCWCWDA